MRARSRLPPRERPCGAVRQHSEHLLPTKGEASTPQRTEGSAHLTLTSLLQSCLRRSLGSESGDPLRPRDRPSEDRVPASEARSEPPAPPRTLSLPGTPRAHEAGPLLSSLVVSSPFQAPKCRCSACFLILPVPWVSLPAHLSDSVLVFGRETERVLEFGHHTSLLLLRLPSARRAVRAGLPSSSFFVQR